MNITPLNLVRLIPILLASSLPLTANAATLSAANYKLDKRLAVIAAAAQEHRAQPLMAAALTRELFRQSSPLETRWNAAGQVQVYLHYDRNGNLPNSAELAALGASGILNSPALGVIQAWIPANKLEDAAALTEVKRVSVPHYAFTRRSPPVNAQTRTGSVDTEGDEILGASQFRSTTNYTGQGMVAGVVSNGDSGVSTSQGTGDLPSNIWDDPNNTTWKSSGAEGTAMMEIVYDVAPGLKQLGFAGPGTSAEFLTALNDLATNINPNVIVDDLGFIGESMFSNGAFATGVNDFAAAHPDIHLVTAAGNDATAYWAGPWILDNSVNKTVNSVPYTQGAMNFGSQPGCSPPPGIGQALCFQVGGTNVLSGGDTIVYTVIWNDPWDSTDNTDLGSGYVSPSDYDVVLFDSSGNALACNQGENLSTTNGMCNQQNTAPLTDPGPTPIQGNAWQNTSSSTATVYLQIFSVNDSMPSTRQFKVLINSVNSYVLSVTPNTATGSIYGHSAIGVPVGSALTPDEITVGAVEPNNSPYSIEPYSSTGPVLFGTDDQGPFPYEQIQKPDFVAPDCVTTTGAGSFPEPFCGTSAAAPHIAGLLVLLIPAYPGTDPYMLLQDSASQPAGGANPNGIYGFGLPDIYRLLTSGTYPATGAEITSPANGATIQGGQSTTFQGQCLGYDGTNNFTYNWNFGTNSIKDSSSQNPSVTYNTAGTYTVTLNCTDTVGSGSTTSAYTVTTPRFVGSGGSMDILALVVLALLAIMRVASARRRA